MPITLGDIPPPIGARQTLTSKQPLCNPAFRDGDARIMALPVGQAHAHVSTFPYSLVISITCAGESGHDTCNIHQEAFEPTLTAA